MEKDVISERQKNTVGNALKWSFAAEIAAKLMLPLSNMVLSRLLTPEMFGVVATVTMVTSFADIFTDAGFQKYIVQHEFANEEEKHSSTNVAFWTNFSLSLFIWGIIIVFRDSIAELVGNKGLGNVIALCSVTIPMTAFSSLQAALFRRDLNFKKLFQVRIIGASVPVFINIPLAFFMRNYKAILIGTVLKCLLDVIVLMWGAEWKPTLSYKFSLLKEMFSYSSWSLVESITVWLTSYIGTFIVGNFLSMYYVGLYKVSITTVNQILSIITASTAPVLFSTLSRLQNDTEKFNDTFFKFQRMVAVLIVPMSVGILLYRELITQIVLGSQWKEAADFIGLWGAANAITVVWANYCSEIYRAKGKPKISVLAQVLHLAILIPTLYISSGYGFKILYISRTMVKISFILINFILCFFFTDVSPLKMVKNVLGHIVSALAMAVVALGLQQISQSVLWELCSIVICAVVYFLVLLMFPKIRKEIFETDIVVKVLRITRVKR